MKTVLLLACIVVCGCATHRLTDPWPSEAQDDSDWLVSGLVSFLGETQCITRVTRADIRRTPDWNPESHACPMSVERAVSHAVDWVGSKLPDMKWRFHRVTLHHVIGTKWYYAVYFREERDFEKDNVRSWPIVVMLDGTVKGPERLVVERDPDTGDLRFVAPLE